jgi:hypothetical protein
MASGADIRAGKAFVEVYANKSALVRDLKAIGGELKAWGAGITAAGKRLAILGAAAFVPMLAAAKSWAESGSALYKLSEQTRMSAESLSALKYVASETQVPFETLAMAGVKANRMIYAAATGSQEAAVAIAQLGLNAAQLLSMSPEAKLELLVDRLAQIKNPVIQDALAMKLFERNAEQLLPLLRQGASGLREMREEAAQLGMIRSAADVAAAFQMTRAWDRLLMVFGRLRNAVGSSLAPMLTNLFKSALLNVKAASDWVNANRPLVVQFFQIAAAVLGLGGGLILAGKAITFLGSMFRGAAGMITGFAHGLGIVIKLLALPLKVAASIVSAVLGAVGGALSLVRSGFHAVASVAAGAFSAGMRIAQGAISMVTMLARGPFSVAMSLVSGALSGVGWLARGALSLGFSLASKAVSAAADVMSDVLGNLYQIALSVGEKAFQLIGRAAMAAAQMALASIPAGWSVVLDTLVLLGDAARLAGSALGAVGRAGIALAAGAAEAFAMLVPLLIPLAGLAVVVGGLTALGKAFTALDKAAAAAASTIRSTVESAGQAIGAAAEQAKNAAAAIGTSLTASATEARSWASSLAGTFASVWRVAVNVFGRLRSDVVAGFHYLVADVNSAWSSISRSLKAGDMTSPWKVAMATLILEWERFRGWMVGSFEDMKPALNKMMSWVVEAWNTSVAKAGEVAGGLFAELKIAWGDLWDLLLKGLASFLTTLDTGLDSIRKMMETVRSFLGNLPGAYGDERATARNKAFADMARRPGESAEDARKRTGRRVGESDLDFVNRKGQEAVDALVRGGPTGPPLATLIPGPRSAKQRAKDEAEARQEGAGMAGRIGGLRVSPPAPIARDPWARGEADNRIEDAEKQRDAAIKEAAERAAELEKKRKKEAKELQDKLGMGQGGLGGMLGGKVSGTFNAMAAGQMGSSNMERANRHLKELVILESEMVSGIRNVHQELKVK